MRALLFYLLASMACAGETFTTKNHIMGRGVNLSFELPDGLKRHEDALAMWWAAGDAVTMIELNMYKHDMHTEAEKMARLASNKKGSTKSRSIKLGNEPAVITETLSANQYNFELWVYPGDTTIHLFASVQNWRFTSLETAVEATRPIIERMLKSVKLD